MNLSNKTLKIAIVFGWEFSGEHGYATGSDPENLICNIFTSSSQEPITGSADPPSPDARSAVLNVLIV